MGVAGIAAAKEDLHSRPAAIAGDYFRMIKWRLTPGYIYTPEIQS